MILVVVIHYLILESIAVTNKPTPKPAETVEKVFLEGLIFHRNQILGGFSKSKSVSLIILAGFPFNLVLRT